MILVIGGSGSGKRQFVEKNLGYRAGEITADLHSGSPVVEGVYQMVRNNPGQVEMLYRKLRERTVVTCNEVGCGVVPIDLQERQAREETGRLCIVLAQSATAVVRLTCGIPEIIKGSL